MQTARARIDPALRHLHGIAKHSGLVHIALFQAHGLAVFEVNGWDEDHGFQWRKFL